MLAEKNLESSESCKQQESLNAQLKDMQTLHLEDMSKADAMRTSLVEEITILRKELNQARDNLKLESDGKQELTKINNNLHQQFETYRQQCTELYDQCGKDYQQYKQQTEEQHKQHTQQQQDLQLQNHRLQQELEAAQAKLTSMQADRNDYNTDVHLEREQQELCKQMFSESAARVTKVTREKNNLEREVSEIRIELNQRQKQIDEQALRVVEAEVLLTFT